MKIFAKMRLAPYFLLLPALNLFAEEEQAAETGARAVFSFELPSYMPLWMHREVMGVSLWQFFMAFFFVLIGMALKKISNHIFDQKLIPIFKKTRIDLDNLFLEALSRPFGVLLLIGGLSVAFGFLPLPTEPNVHEFVFRGLQLVFIGNIIWFFFRVVDIAVQYLSRLAARTDSKLDEQLVPLVSRAIKVTIGAISFLWIMQLLDYNISSLIAGLGIGGLAVALALQDTLANFFGSVFIFLDRPFMVGDIIKVGDVEGTVTDIGFRTTRIRTFPATMVSIPNKTIANATIDNLSKRPKRRVTQTVGVTYETTADQMEKAVSSIRSIIENDEGVDEEFVFVRFTDFGDSSLNIFLLYFTKDVSFAVHSEVKERINLAIMKALKEQGLSIAFPTRSIYIENAEKAGKSKSQKKDEEGKSLPF